MKRSLTKQERIRGRALIRDCFTSGSPVSCRGSKLLTKSNDLTRNRLLLVPTRKYGNAVARNRAKRFGREAFRCHKARLSPGHDLVWILYPGTDSLLERSRQFLTLCRRAHLLGSDRPSEDKD